ncbi:nitrilase-related carbon-nitrogen hydrolase [Sulfuracidifex metallicus]|jgi:N-carbamoylputrescine amidase|uniref:Acyltransferase n=1 Tax=Sulfuracidifex metallicus DSM 6482 = JCM 9184 TaxID=523847 RepID=A0A6A9QVP8_SULME|nr:nitrilase-related carbon-nitrogen hydrolase [Sulfuracidifex metallicus]MUN29132.1 acyltransferase [Sulfuracidifex metallicus DSM 6482 = JCM 9184]WOE50346.1 nitrilase-related carbon-nitrogen hydrolase [Sulfuracidifex metallicus DSM 6482 = JCM 9184]
MRIALVQTHMTWDKEDNVKRQMEMVNKAADGGAKIVALDELSNTVYFAFEQNVKYFSLAETENGPTITAFRMLAKERGVNLIVPIFERDGTSFYNTAFIINSNGSVVGKYRKTHLPQDNYFNEYYYFKIGDLGFPVFQLEDTKVGVVICHDRHFPETVRAEVVNGAEIVFVPSVAYFKEIWELELKAHAIFNTVYIAGINRVGKEYPEQLQEYFGDSMIVSPMGDVISKVQGEGIAYAEVDKEELIKARLSRPFLKKRLSSYGL